MCLPDEVVFLANAGIEREVRKSEEHATDDPHEESTEANGRIGKGSPRGSGLSCAMSEYASGVHGLSAQLQEHDWLADYVPPRVISPRHYREQTMIGG